MKNPPAFPGVTYISINGEKNPEGMTLRDYFAAKAMQGMLAGQDRRLVATKEFIGETAYEYADSMMKARES
jgi:hypothetical protein